MKAVQDINCQEFVEMIASKAPVPGGGGVSSYVAALGIALSNMVGSLTLGKKKYAEVEKDIIDMKKKADALQKDFLQLISDDANAFLPLSKAYGLPKDTPDQLEYKNKVMEKVLLDASNVPLMIMEKCCESIKLAKDFAEKGSKIAISDAGCSAIICKGALRAAALNVFINTKLMKNHEIALEINNKAEKLLNEGCNEAEAVYCLVLEHLR